MPVKINFHVIYATSEDPSYPACELNNHGPAVRGWRSRVGSSEPHELLLRLTMRTSITKIQLLAHHQFIPRTVELLVYDPDPSGTAVQTPCGATYTNIGHVELNPPALGAEGVLSDCSMLSPLRELKTALLPEAVPARFLRLKLSGPHATTLKNTSEQVALMAINVLGYEINDSGKMEISHGMDKYFPYDDLTFVMYMDFEVAHIVRKLEEKKKTAITEERFEYARKLKVAVNSLQSVGQRLGRWALRKRLAALAEDYEEARLHRDRLVAAHSVLHANLLLLRLLEDNEIHQQNDELSSEEIDFAQLLKCDRSQNPSLSTSAAPTPRDIVIKPDDIQQKTTQSNSIVNSVSSTGISHVKEVVWSDACIPQDKVDTLTNYSPSRTDVVTSKLPDHRVDFVTSYTNGSGSYTNSPVNSPSPTNAMIARRKSGVSPTGSRSTSKVKMRAKSGSPSRRANRNSYEAYEERAVPALRHSNTNEYLRECQLIETDILKVSSKLNEKEKKQAALPIIIFGEALVEKFYSKNFTDKEDGLHRLKIELLSYETKKTAAVTPTAQRNVFAGSKSLGTCTSPNKIGRAAMFLIHRALRDKVFSVYSLSTEIVKVFFSDFVPDRLCPAEITRSVDRVIPELLIKAGDQAPRINSLAMHTILTMAECPQVRSLYILPQYLTRSVSGNSHPRMTLSRLEMIEQLVLSQGLGKDKQSGLTVRKVSEISAAALTHASSGVRAVAERLLVLCYEKAPRVVRSQLPPDDSVSRRNLLYRSLFQQFDRIDSEKTYPNNMDELSTLSSSIQVCNGKPSTPSRMATSLTSSLMANSFASSMGTSMYSSVMSFAGRTVPRRNSRRQIETIGYNKLRLDSAASPKHRVKSPGSVRVNGWLDNKNANTHMLQDTKEMNVSASDVSSNNMIKVKSTQSLVYKDDGNVKNGQAKVVKSKSGSNISMSAVPRTDELNYYDSFDESQFEETEKPSVEPSIGSTRSDTSTPEYDITLEGVLCTFCNMAVSGSIDEHYWKQCPLLTRCQNCKDVIEARRYNEHLIHDCAAQNSFKMCTKCLQAIHNSMFNEHVTDNRCVDTPVNHNKCPHCSQNIPVEEEFWRHHFMSGEGTCGANPRKNISMNSNSERSVMSVGI